MLAVAATLLVLFVVASTVARERYTAAGAPAIVLHRRHVCPPHSFAAGAAAAQTAHDLLVGAARTQTSPYPSLIDG